jgi:shikimate 5-dehydrogenase
LINATPIGMTPDEAATPMPADRLTHFRLVIDAVAIPPESRLCRESRARGISVVAGHELALRQAMVQFRLYTGVPAPEAAMAAALADVVAAR